MNQIKYLVNASLLLLFLTFGISTIHKLSSTEFISQKSTIIDSYEPSSKNVVINSEGKNIFQSNCQSCHSINKTLTGPALGGVESRGPWTDRNNLIKWVKNPAGTINLFDYTKKLVNEYNGQIMPSFEQLTDKQIEDIFDYIKSFPRG